MIKEIKYNGYSAQPSDYECPDGDLAISFNLLSEDGSLQSIPQPATIRNLPSGYIVTFIHQTTAFIHYILHNPLTGNVTYITPDPDSTPVPVGTFSNIIHFNAVGNTLLVFTKTEMIYLLWKNNSYLLLGNHIPEINISFGLVGHPRLYSVSGSEGSTFTITFDSIPPNLSIEFSEDNKTKITEQVMARLNKFVRQETIEKGRFCFPFFLRYALRLFDGSLVNHSAPILLNPSTTTGPVVLWNRITGPSYTSADLDIMLLAADLDYQILNTSINDLQNWSDIITDIEIYISKPIYTYDQNGKCTNFNDTDNLDTKFIGRLYDKNPGATNFRVAEDRLLGGFQSKNFLQVYNEWTYAQIYEMYFSANRTHPGTTLHLPEFSDKKNTETLNTTAQFYRLATLNLSQATNTRISRTILPIENDYLATLTARPAMTDDYLTHDQLVASTSYIYNSRLNLTDVSRRPFQGFLPQSMFAYCSNYCNYQKGENNVLNITPVDFGATDTKVTVYLTEDSHTYALTAHDPSAGQLARFVSYYHDPNQQQPTKRSWGCFLFYPNINAKKILISNFDHGDYLITLQPHDFLNGAYALLDYELVRETNYTPDQLPVPNPPADGLIPQPNKIYTSQVNNPFYFPVSTINTVGTQKILALATAAKALSEGQFGQFPLYAFTQDGVWAMEVSSTGTYIARQPITRDVCTNPSGITQIDSAVLFPTDRGIMLLSGSTATCISDTIDNNLLVSLGNLPQLSILFPNLPTDLQNLPPFKTFLQGCRIIYDYPHQHIIIYNPSQSYAYVFSIKTKQWGMMKSDFSGHINSYPEAIAITHNGEMVNFSLTDPTPVTGLLLTRPIKLQMPDVLKTIDTVIQHGHFRRHHIQSALYGSRDLLSWHLIWTSTDHYLRGFHGTPYKYFRIALICNLTPGESLLGATIRFTPRLTNKPR